MIGDNSSFHSSGRVRASLTKWGYRIMLRYLPKYFPETNPTKRVWRQLHETLTCNHGCATVEELLADVFAWINANCCFHTEDLSRYTIASGRASVLRRPY